MKTDVNRLLGSISHLLISAFGLFVRVAVIVFAAFNFGCLVCPFIVTIVVRLMGIPVSAGLDLKVLFWFIPAFGVLLILSVFLLKVLFLLDSHIFKFFDRLSCKVESMIEREVKK